MAGILGLAAPKAQPTVKMPDAQDPTVLAAQDAQRRRALAGGGRDSTNLTGSGTYQNTTLGS